MVKRLGGEGLGKVGPARHHRHLQRVEVRGTQFGNQRSRARQHLRRFEDGPVASGQGRRQRAEQGVQRRVPGADDAHRALGLVTHPGLGTQLVVGREWPALVIRHPLLQVVPGVLEAGQGTDHVVHQGEAGRPATEVFIDGLGQALMVAHQQVDHLLQTLPAALGTDRALGSEGAFLPR
ncbi:hypothetical protein D3C79_807430 [compost metagenome]